MAIEEPDMNAWLAQAKESEQAPNIGMFLMTTHRTRHPASCCSRRSCASCRGT